MVVETLSEQTLPALVPIHHSLANVDKPTTRGHPPHSTKRKTAMQVEASGNPAVGSDPFSTNTSMEGEEYTGGRLPENLRKKMKVEGHLTSTRSQTTSMPSKHLPYIWVRPSLMNCCVTQPYNPVS
jgi:hypothetical protein